MSSSNLLVTYLGAGLASARPATPSIAVGTVGIWWNTDTKTLDAYDLTNAAWNAIGGGGSAGTPPTVVQFASDKTGADTVTFSSAPTNGNLLVAISFNPSTDTAGSGWTAVGSNGSGTDFGTVFTKTAGASESATQQPINSAPGTGCMGVWELHNAAGGIITASLAPEVSAINNATGPLPNLTNVLFLGGIGLVSTSNSINVVYNVTVDHQDASGTGRQGAWGHSTAAIALGQMLATFTGSGTPSSKALGVLVSA